MILENFKEVIVKHCLQCVHKSSILHCWKELSSDPNWHACNVNLRGERLWLLDLTFNALQNHQKGRKNLHLFNVSV